MITRFKSALNRIKAEDDLKSSTEKYLINKFEIEKNFKNEKYKGWRFFTMNKKILASAVIAIFTLGGGTSAYAYYQTPVSYLSLDINPSVELGVNAFGTVVTAEGYNKDGQTILSNNDVTGSNVTEAVDSLVTSAVDNGFIAKDGSSVISLTSETNNNEAASELQKDAEDGANNALEKKDGNAEIVKDNVALARRDEARKLGVTPGKLNLINKLQAVVATATVEQYKDATVKEIMKTIKANKENGNSKKKDIADQKTVNAGQSTSNTQTSITTDNSTTQSKDNNRQASSEDKNKKNDNENSNTENLDKANKVNQNKTEDVNKNDNNSVTKNSDTNEDESVDKGENSQQNKNTDKSEVKSNNGNEKQSDNGKSSNNKR